MGVGNSPAWSFRWRPFPRALVVVALLLGVTSAARSQPHDALRLTDADSHDVGEHARVYSATADESVEDYEALRASGRFDRPAADGAERLAAGGELWVILDVERAPTSSQRDWVLWDLGAAQWLDARVAIEGRGVEIMRNGFFVSPQYRPIQAIGYAFPVRLEPGERGQIVLRGYLPPREDHQMVLASAPHFHFNNLLSMLLVFGVMGAALALGAYNAAMYAVLRERAYGYYAFYALSSVLLWASTHSVLNLFIHDGPFALTLNGLTVLLTAFAALRFTHEFLELRRIARPLHVVFQVLNVAFLGLLIALVVLPQPEFKRLASLVAIPTMAAVVVAPIYALRRGHRRARLMVIGWAPLMVVPLLIGMRSLGLIQASWVSTRLMILLHGFEILTMALALSDRWRELDRARRRAQDEAVEQLQLRVAQSEQLARAEIASHSARLEAERERVRGSIDALTGVGNRRAFDADLKALNPTAAAEASVDVLLCIIDVDGLKHVNDTAGHAEGDRLLVQLGRHLTRSLRGMDQIYRLGGDEFAVVARAPSLAAQTAIENQIRAAVEQLREEFPDAGASVGSARLSETEGDVDEAYRLADERMYRQKRAHHAARRDDPRPDR